MHISFMCRIYAALRSSLAHTPRRSFAAPPPLPRPRRAPRPAMSDVDSPASWCSRSSLARTCSASCALSKAASCDPLAASTSKACSRGLNLDSTSASRSCTKTSRKRRSFLQAGAQLLHSILHSSHPNGHSKLTSKLCCNLNEKH